MRRHSEHSQADSNNPGKSAAQKPRHIVGWIDSNVTVSEFLDLLKERDLDTKLNSGESRDTQDPDATCCGNEEIGVCSSSNDKTTGCQEGMFVLTGLHACGDLTPTLMRVFSSCALACSLVSVSCCYHKLTTGREKEK